MITLEQLEAEAESWGVAVDSRILPDTLMGVYSHEHRLILMDSRLNCRQQRCVLAHELVHAWFGDEWCDGLFGGKAEARTRRIAARLLIGVDDYRMAEAAYNGMEYPMAESLDVTVQVLEDYRSLLEGSLRDAAEVGLIPGAGDSAGPHEPLV